MRFDGENVLVGLVCLALVFLIAARIVRAVRTGRVPLYRSTIDRGESEGKFFALLAVHGLSLLVMGFIAADLLLGLGFRD